MRAWPLLLPLALLACDRAPHHPVFDYELRVCVAEYTHKRMMSPVDWTTGPCEPYAPLDRVYRTTKKLCEDFARSVEQVKSMEEGFAGQRRWQARCEYREGPK
jgi:hypothetical protein